MAYPEGAEYYANRMWESVGKGEQNSVCRAFLESIVNSWCFMLYGLIRNKPNEEHMFLGVLDTNHAKQKVKVD